MPSPTLATFNPTPSIERAATVAVTVARSAPDGAGALGVPVGVKGPVPRQVGLDRSTLAASGFEGKLGQTLVVPRKGGPSVIAVGIGDPAELTPAGRRDAAAAFARAAAKHDRLATTLADAGDAEAAAQAVVEGVLLARYRYAALKKESNGAGLAELVLVTPGGQAAAAARGAERGRVLADAAQLARDLANTPPGHLTASRMADVAIAVAASSGLDVEIFDGDALAALGCGGLLGVNAGSTEPPRMIKLTYRPSKPVGHLAMVGKGVMYDSGGISLKPTDPMHAAMKMDMSGAAAVLSAMSALQALGCRAAVTGFMLCTDNMPSGSAMKLGDVLTIRGGTTVEIHNTDAEGRLLLADGLALAVEDQPDAIVDIATLTGACVVALGQAVAGVFGNDQPWVDQVNAASDVTDEPVWQLPLEKQRYRKLLDSDIADLKNVGGPYGGSITAAVFLSEFVGDVPWAHLDIAGPMKVDADESWRSKGATGFGTRLLAELAVGFKPPGSIWAAIRLLGDDPSRNPRRTAPRCAGSAGLAQSSSHASAAAGGGTPTATSCGSSTLRSSPAASIAVASAWARASESMWIVVVVHCSWAVCRSGGRRRRWRWLMSGSRRRTTHVPVSCWMTPNMSQRCTALANGEAVPLETLRPRARAVAETSSS